MTQKESILFRLTELMFQKQQTFLLLDELYEDEIIGSSIRNIQIDCPFQQLLFDGVLSQYIIDNSVSISFTVEAYFQHLLARVLEKDSPYTTPESLLQLLKENKLKGIPEAVSNLLSFDVEKGEFGRLTDFIDLNQGGNEILELCVMPVIQSLLKNGVKVTIEVILENQTENDWNILLKLDKGLAENEMHVLRKEFFNKVMHNNKLDHKYAIELGLKAIPVLDEKDALRYMDKISQSLSFIIDDEYLLAQLADCEEKFGNYDKSLELNEKSLAVILEKYSEDHPDLTTTYNHIGFAWDKKGKYEIALEYLNKGLTKGIKELGENDPSIATSYNNIGLVYDKKGEYNKALEFYEKSLEIYLKSFGSAHTHVATVYNNIGLTYDKKLDYYKTLKYLEKSLDINLKIFGHDHFYVGALYNNFGYTWASIGELNKAIEFYEKALVIYSKALGELHPDLATTYHNIGYTWTSKGEFDKALEFYQKALGIFLKTSDGNHPNIATTYNDIGLAYAHKCEFNAALIYYEKSLPIYLAFLDSKHPNVANLYDNIGNVLCNLGVYKKAIEYYEKCLHIRLERSEEKDLEGIYFDIGDALIKNNQHEKAINYLLKANNITSQGGYAYRLAKCYESLREMEKALDYYIQTSNIRKEKLGPGDSNTIDSINDTKRIAKELNKENELPDWIKNYKTE